MTARWKRHLPEHRYTPAEVVTTRAAVPMMLVHHLAVDALAGNAFPPAPSSIRASLA